MDRLQNLPSLPADYVTTLLSPTSIPAPTQKVDLQKPDSPGAKIARLKTLLDR
jgi:hypothetical protein